MDNGGIAQFFYNTCGEYTAETIAALRVIELDALADVLEEAAAAVFPNGPAKDLQARNDQMEANVAVDDSNFKDWDGRSYRAGGGERIYERLAAWYPATLSR